MLVPDKEIDVGLVAKFSFSIELFLSSLCIQISQGHTRVFCSDAKETQRGHVGERIL